MALPIIAGSDWLSLVIFAGYTFGASFGLPGGLIVLVSAGAFANTAPQLLILMLIAAAMSIAGDIAAYELARKFSKVIYRRLSRFKSFREGEPKVRGILKKTEFPLIFFTRFAITALGSPVSYISGLESLDRKKFYLAVISGESIYGIIYPLAGFIFKETWNDLLSLIADSAAVLVLLVITFLLIKKFVPRKQGK